MKYLYIVVPFTTIITCQIIKFFVEAIITKKFNLYRLLNGAGGMPSSHSSFVTSLTTIIGLTKGFDSVYFAICLIFSLVVMYDAMGVRYESGKQAEAINDLVEDLILCKKKKLNYKVLKEQLGHKPLEVLCGLVLGVSVALFFHYMIFI